MYVRPGQEFPCTGPAILAVEPGVTDDDVNARLTARLKRQAILTRDDPPAAWFLVDVAALRRCVGSPDVMAAQPGHLAGLAGLPNVSIQVVPNIADAGLLGGFAVAERAAYVEPRWLVRCSRTLTSLPDCLPVSIRVRADQEPGFAVYVPRPWTVTTLPRSRSTAIARRTVTRDTPYWSASSSSVGRRVSGPIKPESMSASMSAATWSVIVVAES